MVSQVANLPHMSFHHISAGPYFQRGDAPRQACRKGSCSPRMFRSGAGLRWGSRSRGTSAARRGRRHIPDAGQDRTSARTRWPPAGGSCAHRAAGRRRRDRRRAGSECSRESRSRARCRCSATVRLHIVRRAREFGARRPALDCAGKVGTGLLYYRKVGAAFADLDGVAGGLHGAAGGEDRDGAGCFGCCAPLPSSCQPMPVAASMVGTTMPMTLRGTPSSWQRAGSHCCWIQRRATTEAVLQATIASVQPSAKGVRARRRSDSALRWAALSRRARFGCRRGRRSRARGAPR